MNSAAAQAQVPRPHDLATALGAIAGGAAAFHLGWLVPWLWSAALLFLFAIYRLTTLKTPRRAFYAGLVLGWMIFIPHLQFFWTIFQTPALVLWTILALWVALATACVTAARSLLPSRFMPLIFAMVWLATESFRSEGYYLRFSWLSTGYLLAPLPGVGRLATLGVYGLGGLLAWAAAWSDRSSLRASGPRLLGIMALLTALASLPGRPVDSSDTTLRVAGVQLEFPTIERVLTELDQLAEAHPNVSLFVLSEYTVDGLVPDGVRNWCRRHQRYVILGGKEPLGGTQFRNTAYVIDPKGTVVFQQAKSVPIQFFDDGLPAAEQRIWESPWGRIGLAICYDLSYRRVIDELIRGGAQALIVPTMDVEEWGFYQRALHTRIGSMRAAEYRLPVFRLASSGISQIVDATGKVLASGSYPGQGERVSGEMILPRRARLPWDVWLTPLATAGTVVLLTVLSVHSIYIRWSRRASFRATGTPSTPSHSCI